MSTQFLQIGKHQLAAVCLKPGAPGQPVILLHSITSSTSFWPVNPVPYMLELGPCYAFSLPWYFPALAPDDFKSGILTIERLVNPPEALQRNFPPYRQLDLDALLPYFQHMADIDIHPAIIGHSVADPAHRWRPRPQRPPAQSRWISEHRRRAFALSRAPGGISLAGIGMIGAVTPETCLIQAWYSGIALSRYSLGVTPSHFLNDLRKTLGSEKPSR